MKIYYAAPLHQPSDQQFNLRMCEVITSRGHQVYLPQCYGVWEGLVKEQMDKGIPEEKAIEHVRSLLCKMDISAMHRCDCVIAIKPPNRPPSEGMLYELGFAHAINKDTYIVNIDNWRYNLMPEYGCSLMFSSLQECLKHLDEQEFKSTIRMIDSPYRSIQISMSPLIAIVDPEDYEMLQQYAWRDRNGYAAAMKGGQHISMQHLILPKKEGYVVDHINHNKMDNRRCNLRYLTNQENTMNRTKFTNSTAYMRVHHHNSGSYQVMIGSTYIGCHKQMEIAAELADLACVFLYPDIAELNFPENKDDYIELLNKEGISDIDQLKAWFVKMKGMIK